MASYQEQAPLPPTGALAELASEVGSTIDEVARRRDPELTERLRASLGVTVDDRVAVETMLADELSEHVESLSWEPSPYGKKVDDALGWFLERFPISP